MMETQYPKSRFGYGDLRRHFAATAPALWWSAEGQIACDAHKPRQGSDTFRFAKWAPMTNADAKSLAQSIGRSPTCETCDARRDRHEHATKEDGK